MRIHHLEEFMNTLREQDLSFATVRAYSHDLKRFFHWLQYVQNNDISIEKLNGADFIGYREYLINEQKAKPTTVKRRLEALKRLCRWAHGQGILKTDPTKDIKPVRMMKQMKPMGLVEAEVHALLRAAGMSSHGLARRNYALVQVFLQAGLRAGEVASLCITDVTLRDRAGSIRVRHGKGRKERIVPLNAAARRALHQYLESRVTLSPDDPLFANVRGDALSVRSIQHTVSEIARRAQISRIQVSPHTLRHTFSLNYLQKNPGKLVGLANLLGHESLDTTALYTRPSIEELSQDLERSPLNFYG